MKSTKIAFVATTLLLLIVAGFYLQKTSSSNENTTQIDSQQTSTENASTTDSPQTSTGITPAIVFVPDEGIRVELASNPGIKWTEDGTLTLLYENRSTVGGPAQIATTDESTDWLEFNKGEDITREDQDRFHAIELPDGTTRFYGYRPTVGSGEDDVGMKSSSSTDGVTFTEDEGYRYLFQPEDMGNMGTYDFYIDQSGGIVLLYIGDKFGKNNVRRAYSTDNGWTFTFDQGNVLGDDDRNAYQGTFVDQSMIRLEDGRVFLIAMKNGDIYGFVSDDDGKTFHYDSLLLTPEDFTELNLGSLHDPKMILLPDGRIRFYVTAKEAVAEGEDPEDPSIPQHIVSATGTVQSME